MLHKSLIEGENIFFDCKRDILDIYHGLVLLKITIKTLLGNHFRDLI